MLTVIWLQQILHVVFQQLGACSDYILTPPPLPGIQGGGSPPFNRAHHITIDYHHSKLTSDEPTFTHQVPGIRVLLCSSLSPRWNTTWRPSQVLILKYLVKKPCFASSRLFAPGQTQSPTLAVVNKHDHNWICNAIHQKHLTIVCTFCFPLTNRNPWPACSHLNINVFSQPQHFETVSAKV